MSNTKGLKFSHSDKMLLIIVLIFTLSCEASDSPDGDKLVGWLGETYKAGDWKVP